MSSQFLHAARGFARHAIAALENRAGMKRRRTEPCTPLPAKFKAQQAVRVNQPWDRRGRPI
jgi:hypothetical protein